MRPRSRMSIQRRTAPHSYARLSRTLIAAARRAGSQLASSESETTIANQIQTLCSAK